MKNIIVIEGPPSSGKTHFSRCLREVCLYNNEDTLLIELDYVLSKVISEIVKTDFREFWGSVT